MPKTDLNGTTPKRKDSFKKAWFDGMLRGRRVRRQGPPEDPSQRRSFYQRHLAPHRLHLNRGQRRPSRRPSGFDRCLARCFTTVRRLSHFWATHVLLLLFLMVYTVGGAYIFVVLERDAEGILLKESTRIRDQVLKTIWSQCLEAKVLGYERWKRGFKVVVWGNRETLCRADAWTEEHEHTGHTRNPWTFSSAMLFCSTIFTAIGYGNVTPKTTWGQLFTIVYALIGIPYCLAVLADIGQVMRGILRRLYIFSYKFYYLGRCCRCQFTPPAVSLNRFFASTPFFVTDVAADENGASPIEDGSRSISSMRFSADDSLFVLSGLHESDFVVPVWVGWMLLSMYVLAGAFLFTSYESWDFAEALYFVFVSLTTIGFGDFFPEKISLYIVFGYILVGLALVSLFFNLLLEYVQNIMKKAQRKITRAWAARISVVEEGDRTQGGEISPKYSGSLLDVHVVESLPFTLVTSQGFLRQDKTSLSRPTSFTNERQGSVTSGAKQVANNQPIVLVQISDTRVLDYTRSEEPRQLSDEEALLEAARDAVFEASRTRSVLTPSSSSPPASPSPRPASHLHISEGSLLEYMQERMALVHNQSVVPGRSSQTLQSRAWRGLESPSATAKTSSALSQMRRSSSQTIKSPRVSRPSLGMPPHLRRSSISQENQAPTTSYDADDSVPPWVPLRPLQEGVQLEQSDLEPRSTELPVYSPLRRYVAATPQPPTRPSASQVVRISTTKAASFAEIPETEPYHHPGGIVNRLIRRLSSSDSEGSSSSANSRSSSTRIKGRRKKNVKHHTPTSHLQQDSNPSPTSPASPQLQSLYSPTYVTQMVTTSHPSSAQRRSGVYSISPMEQQGVIAQNQRPISRTNARLPARQQAQRTESPRAARRLQTRSPPFAPYGTASATRNPSPPRSPTQTSTHTPTRTSTSP